MKINHLSPLLFEWKAFCYLPGSLCIITFRRSFNRLRNISLKLSNIIFLFQSTRFIRRTHKYGLKRDTLSLIFNETCIVLYVVFAFLFILSAKKVIAWSVLLERCYLS